MATETDILNKYEQLFFPNDSPFVEMFAEIIKEDPWTYEVFKFFMQQRLTDKNKWITVNDITNNVMINRPVKVKKGRSIIFENQTTHIHRKAAGRIVDKLHSMSLLICRVQTPYKFYQLSARGKQILLYFNKEDEKNNG